VAKRIASQAGLDISRLSGSGPDGRILRRDVEAAISGGSDAAARVSPAPASAPATAPTPAARPVAPTAVPERPRPAAAAEGLSRMRQAIARRMTQSKQTQPHYYLTIDVDMTAAMAFRAQLNAAASEQQRVSINDLIVKACAIALQRHPKFNGEFGDDGLVMHPDINICIGIALDDGLIAPALLDCGAKSLGRIAEEAKDLIERAKSGRLTASEYSDGTFTITNLGAYGVESLIGIINPPQAAILGVGSSMAKPVVVDDKVVIRQVMKLALSADHRVSDGAEGARFIKELQGLLENPVTLAL
jgi:pyruvate dehydrogenase E2 component (dihydrolipoamide acetyltransferase)